MLSRKRLVAPDLTVYASALVVAFLIFCFYLNWNPYHSRLHLPLFVLWSPLIALVLLAGTTYKTAFWVAAWLIAVSTLYVAGNESRPLIAVTPNSTVFNTSRIDQVFKRFSRVKDAYLTAVQMVETERCPEVGLDISEYGLEYPFWVLLQKTNRERIWIQHVNVRNISTAKFTAKSSVDFSPCAVISARSDDDEPISEGSTYRKAWSSGSVQVFIKREPPA